MHQLPLGRDSRPAPTRRWLLRAVAAGAAWGAGSSCAFGKAPGGQPPEIPVLAPARPEHQARIDAWNADHAGAARLGLVDSSAAGDGSGAPVAVARALAAGQRAGVAWIETDDVPALTARGALRPLQDLVRRDRYDLKRFMPQALQPAYGVDGQLRALPAAVEARQVYFNRGHFEAAGIDFRLAGFDFERPAMTWEGFRRATLGLVSAYPSRDRLPFVAGHDGAPLELWGWQNGATWIEDGGRRARFDQPAAIEALAWVGAHGRELGDPLRQALLEFPPVARYGTEADRPQDHPFLAGRVSVCSESDRLASTIVGTRPSFPIGYVEPPRRRSGAPLSSFCRAWGYALLRDAPDVTWEALRFLVSEPAARAAARAVASEAPQADADPAAAQARGFQPERRLWYPPFSGQLAVDRLLAQIYRTGHKLLDEARDHGMEQLRHARYRPPCLAPHAVWPLLAEARKQVLLGEAAAPEALAAAQRAAQEALDAARRGGR
jgi:ABC-type glycerol-3-phosphate transport system substrate-binding protein